MATASILLPLPPQGYDATNPPAPRYVNGVPKLLFDADTDEICYWQFRLPTGYASGLTAKIQYSMASATANEVIVAIEVMAVTDADAQDLDVDNYDTANTSPATTVPGTAGYMDEISLALSNDDGVAAGDLVRIKFRRDANNVGDDATGDMELWNVSLEYTTS